MPFTPYLRGMKKPTEAIDAGYITEGTGTEEDPYLIRNTKAMGYMLYEPTAFYKLAEDLDFQGVESTPIGTSSQPFKGGFDGDGHSIKNFKLKTGNSYAGIFGLAESAKIKNLLIENGEIEQTAGPYTGMLAGMLRDCTVENISVSGVNVTGINETGGLAGYAIGGNVTECSVEGRVVGTWYVGGLLGSVYATISNSFAVGDVQSTTNDFYTGGVAGYAENAAIKNCYAACCISKEGSGLVPKCRNATVENSYYDRKLCKDSPVNDYNKGKLTAALLRKETYENWNFEKVWGIEEGKSYPYLRSMKNSAKIVDAGYITEGVGTEENPYRISNPKAMEYINYELTGFYQLDADLDFEGKEIVPIGNSNSPFVGGFNGNKYSIKNFKIISEVSYSGLFGCAEFAKLKNLLIENGEIKQTGGSCTGTLAGELKNCTVENIGMADVSVTGINETGGLAGNVIGGSITDCNVQGNVIGTLYVGGLVGSIYATISNSFAMGDVQSTTNDFYAGGLIGYAADAMIKNCYAACSVSRGGSGLVSVCRYTTVENSYYNRCLYKDAPSNDHNKGKLTAALLRKENYEGWDFEKVWEIEEGKNYPYLRGMKKPSETIDAGYITEGTGTEENPYLIRNTGAMEYMNYEPTAFYKLAEDLDFQGVETKPVGEYGNHFTGGFDGDGHSIKNFKLKTGNSYAGIFGLAESAKIKDLLIENGEIEQTEGSYAGILAGELRNCTVENIGVTGCRVTGLDEAGGLAGYVNGGSITGCSVQGSITGRNYIGGLAGMAKGSISDCFVIGDVASTTNSSYAGGLTGYAFHATIKNCYAACCVNRSGKGLVYVYTSTAVENSYFDSDLAGITTPSEQARTTEQMLDKETYVGWDWQSIWNSNEKYYPTLKAFECTNQETFKMTNRELTCTSIIIDWTETQGATAYEIAYSDKKEILELPKIMLTDLMPDTDYEFRVRPIIGDKKGMWSKLVRFKTRKISLIDNLHCLSKTTDSITLTWNKVEDAVGYEVMYNDEFHQSETNTYTITGLYADTSYVICVRALLADGSTVTSDIITEKINAFEPQTDYAKEFTEKCEEQKWFIDEIERLLNLKGKSINTIKSKKDFATIYIIDLANRDISGKVPVAIGEIGSLRYLYLNNNSLSGKLPDELSRLDKLIATDMSGNQFSD